MDSLRGPQLKPDELAYRLNWYINIRWLVLLCVAAPNLLLQAINPSPNSPIVSNLIIALGVASYNALFAVLARRKGQTRRYYYRIAIIQIVADILAITFLAYQNGGIESHSPLLYAVPILGSGIFLSSTAMLVTAFSAASVYSILATVQFYRWIPSPVRQNPNLIGDANGFFNILLFISSALIVLAMVGRFFMQLLQRSLKELGHAKQATSEALRYQKEESEKFRIRQVALFDSIGEGLIAFNEYGNITDINHAAQKILGFNKEEMVDKWFPKAIVAVDENSSSINPAERPMVKALESGRPVSTRMNYLRKNGEALPVFMTAAPFLVDGKPAGGVVVFRDFSHEASVEKAKDEFVSVTSHQLRTPLTSIRLFAELMTDKDIGKLNAKQTEYLANIQTSTIRMIRLVSDILNLSKIELGRLKVEPKEESIEQLIKDQVKEVSPIAQKKNLGVVFREPSKPLPQIKIDANLMNQVLHNLLTNALRYTPAGKGDIEISLTKRTSNFEISVKDRGIGIPPEAQPKLFSRFFRADNAMAIEGEGSGLGLYLIKQILETSGGKIKFVSHLNKGTTFYVTIPLKGMKPRKGEVGLASFKDI